MSSSLLEIHVEGLEDISGQCAPRRKLQPKDPSWKSKTQQFMVSTSFTW